MMVVAMDTATQKSEGKLEGTRVSEHWAISAKNILRGLSTVSTLLGKMNLFYLSGKTMYFLGSQND